MAAWSHFFFFFLLWLGSVRVALHEPPNPNPPVPPPGIPPAQPNEPAVPPQGSTTVTQAPSPAPSSAPLSARFSTTSLSQNTPPTQKPADCGPRTVDRGLRTSQLHDSVSACSAYRPVITSVGALARFISAPFLRHFCLTFLPSLFTILSLSTTSSFPLMRMVQFRTPSHQPHNSPMPSQPQGHGCLCLLPCALCLMPSLIKGPRGKQAFAAPKNQSSRLRFGTHVLCRNGSRRTLSLALRAPGAGPRLGTGFVGQSVSVQAPADGLEQGARGARFVEKITPGPLDKLGVLAQGLRAVAAHENELQAGALGARSCSARYPAGHPVGHDEVGQHQSDFPLVPAPDLQASRAQVASWTLYWNFSRQGDPSEREVVFPQGG